MRNQVIAKYKAVLRFAGSAGAFAALYLFPEMVLATGQSLGSVAGTITSSMEGVGKLITAASYIAGLGFALMGMLKFKAHKDNPAQVPLSQPIVLLAISAGLVFLPSLVTTAGSTVFASPQAANASGTGVTGL